jgi:hypothetical protein
MTVSLKIHVGGNYQATVRQSLDGEQIDAYVVGPNEERSISFRHGVKNDFSITEAYLGDAAGPTQAEAAADAQRAQIKADDAAAKQPMAVSDPKPTAAKAKTGKRGK